MDNKTNLSLKQELKMQRDFESQEEQVLLSFVMTESLLKKFSYHFFERFELSDVQFNILMILTDHGTGLRQFELAELLLVNRASLGGVVDRMVKNKLINRIEDPEDRRAKIVQLSDKGQAILKKVKPKYYQQMTELLANTNKEEKNQFLTLLEKFRQQIIKQS